MMTQQATNKKLYKSRKDSMIDGVCGGIAEFFNIDPTIIRIIFFITLFLKGLGFWIYVIAMIIVPPNPEHYNLKKGEKKKHNSHILWGLGLIAVGIFFLTRTWNFPMIWNFPFFFIWNFWDLPWEIIGPILLIGLGLFYIVYILKREKNLENSKMNTDKTQKRLIRPIQGRMIAGVCAAFAEYFNLDPTWIRIGYAFLTIITKGAPLIILYIVLIFIIPKAPEKAT